MKNKNERGSVIVEASIVFPVMFLVIFFMIYAGNAYLQKCRVEAIVNKYALTGAAYCADPQLLYAEGGSIPSVSELEVYPYRFFSSTGAADVETEIEKRIKNKVTTMSSGLFAGMKPKNFTVQADYSNSFLYATFSVDASYKIEIPIRMLGDTENISLKIDTYVEMPVSDSVELIRNIDMIWDYMERFGVAEKIEEAKSKLEDALDKVNDWFDS